jgi:formylglycine-generating enzyme required for sulfatase activity
MTLLEQPAASENQPVIDVRNALAKKFEIVESLGKGELCTVYRAIHRRLNKEVALEILPFHLSQNQEYVDRFHSDARAAGTLSHPNISKILGEGSENDVHYVAVEYLDGTDLRTMVMWKGRIDAEETVKIMAPIAAAVAYANDKGIIHRDLRTSNIIVTDTGRPVLTDFWINPSFRGTNLIGTLEYMSPEQTEGKEPTRSSNIYCLGVILYEALTGKVPFSGSNPFDTVSKIIGSPPVLPGKIAPGMPAWIEEIVLKCLAKVPKDRFASGAELAAALVRERYHVPVVTPHISQRPDSAIPRKDKGSAKAKEQQRREPSASTPRPASPTRIFRLDNSHHESKVPHNPGPVVERGESRGQTVESVPSARRTVEEPPEIRKERVSQKAPFRLLLKTAVPIVVLATLAALIVMYLDIMRLRTEIQGQIAISSTKPEIPAAISAHEGQQATSTNQPQTENQMSANAAGNATQSPGEAIESQEAENSKPAVGNSPQRSESVAKTSGPVPIQNVQPAYRPAPTDDAEKISQLINIQWVFVEGGTYKMGSENFAYTQPIHSVKVPSFDMSETEVTFDQYDKFCEATHTKKPGDNGWGRGRMPVINVSWNDAVAFCRWFSDKTGRAVRLPTEAEYEYAARGGDRSRGYQFSGASTIDAVGWYTDNSGGVAHQVGTKAPNEIGLYDMSGNVWEWCEDWYHQSYDKAPGDGSPWNMEDRFNPYRVVRGGSANGASYCTQVSFRFFLLPYFKDNMIGFRCVREAK